MWGGSGRQVFLGKDRQRQTDADRLPGRCRQAEADRSGAAAAGRGRQKAILYTR